MLDCIPKLKLKATPRVMAIKDKKRPQVSTRIRTILVPTDFSEHSNSALKYAMPFARQFKARIVLLHVIERQDVYPDVYYPKMLTPEQIKLAAEKGIYRVCRQHGLKKPLLREIMVKEGVPHQMICQTALDQKADLIVIATHGRTGLAHVFLGSTTERVVRHAPCLVLVVRIS